MRRSGPSLVYRPPKTSQLEVQPLTEPGAERRTERMRKTPESCLNTIESVMLPVLVFDPML
jgi:hypothetical protein